MLRSRCSMSTASASVLVATSTTSTAASATVLTTRREFSITNTTRRMVDTTTTATPTTTSGSQQVLWKSVSTPHHPFSSAALSSSSLSPASGVAEQRRQIWFHGVESQGQKFKSAKTPHFNKQGPVHLYSTKDKAFDGFIDAPGMYRRAFKNVARRVWSNPGARWHHMWTIVALVGFGLWSMRAMKHEKYKQGLVGPKRKLYKSRLTVIMDLDETLLSFGDKAYRLKAGLVPRPYLSELLDYLTEIDAEVILWSGASARYTQQVLKAVDPEGKRFATYLSRDESWFVPGDPWYEKNARWMGRNMKNTLMIENRAISVRGCNDYSILVPDFIRGEYMEDGRDYPHNDKALLSIKQVIHDLNNSEVPVDAYLRDSKNRNPDVKNIPAHLAMPQLPDELTVGDFYFVGNKFLPGGAAPDPSRTKSKK